MGEGIKEVYQCLVVDLLVCGCDECSMINTDFGPGNGCISGITLPLMKCVKLVTISSPFIKFIAH